MTDIEIAIEQLPGHTLVLCKNGELITSDKRGVAPMLDLIREGRDVTGYCAADRVIGKAAAMLFIKAGVREVFADTLSEGAAALLKTHGIPFRCSKMTDRIMNRAKNGLCPMEIAVSDTDDIDTGVMLISRRLDELQAKN